MAGGLHGQYLMMDVGQFFQSGGKCTLSWWQVDVCMADGDLARYGFLDPCRNSMETPVVSGEWKNGNVSRWVHNVRW